MNPFKKFMYEKGLTRKEFCKLIGCSMPTLERILKGKIPSEKFQYRLNKLLEKEIFILDKS